MPGPLRAVRRRRHQRRRAATAEHRRLAREVVHRVAAGALRDGRATLEDADEALILRPTRPGAAPVEVRADYPTWRIDIAGDDPPVQLWHDDPAERAERLETVLGAVIAGGYTRTVERRGRGQLTTLRLHPPGADPIEIREHHLGSAEEEPGSVTRPAW